MPDFIRILRLKVRSESYMRSKRRRCTKPQARVGVVDCVAAPTVICLKTTPMHSTQLGIKEAADPYFCRVSSQPNFA
jgi:hypothetical protein